MRQNTPSVHKQLTAECDKAESVFSEPVPQEQALHLLVVLLKKIMSCVPEYIKINKEGKILYVA
jgi:hypothetical protein